MEDDITPELAAKLDADRRETWELMTLGERLLAGVAMFDINMMMMRAGIRLRFPGAADEVIEQKVVQQLQDARRFEATR
jgi:hypothetical protein